jgi:hypothetical protein
VYFAHTHAAPPTPANADWTVAVAHYSYGSGGGEEEEEEDEGFLAMVAKDHVWATQFLPLCSGATNGPRFLAAWLSRYLSLHSTSGAPNGTGKAAVSTVSRGEAETKLALVPAADTTVETKKKSSERKGLKKRIVASAIGVTSCVESDAAQWHRDTTRFLLDVQANSNIDPQLQSSLLFNADEVK